MKKTLLFFLFLFTNIFYAQISNLEGCQNFPEFDLTTKNAELIGNLNPNTTVSYHLSLADANNNANAILDPTAYYSPNTATIYARINNNGAISTNYFNLTFGPPLQVIWTQVVQTCLGYSQENITMMVTGGKGPYFYSLDYGQNYTYLRNFHLEPGTYTVLVKDSNNCPASNPVFMEVQPTKFLTAAATVTEGVNCGDKDSVTITASGGQGSYTYSFDGVNYSNTNTTNNLKTGTSILYVKDQNNCIANTTVMVNNYKYDFNSTVVIKQISCLDEKGSITVQGTGGKPPYLYSLNGASYDSKNTFNNLVAGTYQINTKDDLGCSSSFYAVINSFEPLIVDASSINVSCHGDSSGSIKINASGGSGAYTYSVSKNNIQIISNTTNNVFNNLSAGSYTITITDPNTACIALMEVYILEPSSPLVANFTVENQTLTINATGGSGEIVYALTPNLDKFSTQNVFQNLAPGIYQAFVRDANGCAIIYDVVIDVPAPLINGKSTITIEFTAGQTLGALVVEGQNIKWYSSANNAAKKTNKSTEATLPLTTLLVDGTTYYASQTINGIESTKRLAVTAKAKGSLSTPDFVLPNFTYYPNPVQHTLSISNTSNIDEVEIFSVSGKSILSKKINSDHSEIDLSNVASGFYFLKVTSEGKTKTIKIVKK